MLLTEDSARHIAEQFQREEPEARYKQARRVSRRELVGSMYAAIIARRKAGYSFEGIVALLARLGAPMSVSTLQSYLLEAGREAKDPRAAVARHERPTTGAHRHGKTQRLLQNRVAPAATEGSRERNSKAPTKTSGRGSEAMPTANPDANSIAATVTADNTGLNATTEANPDSLKTERARARTDAPADAPKDPARDKISESSHHAMTSSGPDANSNVANAAADHTEPDAAAEAKPERPKPVLAGARTAAAANIPKDWAQHAATNGSTTKSLDIEASENPKAHVPAPSIGSFGFVPRNR